MGLPLFYLNGQVTSGPLAGSIASEPTLNPVEGGSLEDGEYHYRVCSILRKEVDNTKWLTCPTQDSLAGVAGEGNNQIQVTWENPTQTPTGYSPVGTAIYRTSPGGAPNSQRLLVVLINPNTTYLDDGTVELKNSFPPPPVFQHSFVPASPSATTEILPSFTVSKLMDNDRGERFVGCRMNTLKLAVGGADSPVTLDWELMAKDWEDIENPSPTFNLAQPFMNWQARFTVDGAMVDRLEGLELTVSNGLQTVPGLSGSPTIRNIHPGIREVSGSMTLAFENHDYWMKVRDSRDFQGVIEMFGDPVSPDNIDDPEFIQPWRYGAQISLAHCKPSEAGSNLSGAERMTEKIPFVVYNDPGLGYEVEFVLYNTTPGYSS